MLIRFAALYTAFSLPQSAQVPVDTNTTLNERFTPRREGFFRLYLQLTNYVVIEPQCSSPLPQNGLVEHNPDPVQSNLNNVFPAQDITLDFLVSGHETGPSIPHPSFLPNTSLSYLPRFNQEKISSFELRNSPLPSQFASFIGQSRISSEKKNHDTRK